jgi:predicted ATP-grasp superfamily ATP-dependent carboligase
VAAGNGRFPGIDHADAYEAVFNKATFLRHAKRLGLSTPGRIAMDGLPAHYPVIVKPVDAFSGKGITVLRRADQTDFDAAVANARAASASGEVIIEEYVEGQLYSHSAFIRNGRVLVDFLVREDCTANPFVVDTSCVADLPTAEVDKLRHYAEQIAGDLNLVDGLLHTQFIRGDAGVYLIETTRRCPGDLYSQLIELTTGFPYARAYVMPFLGQSPNTRHAVPHRNPIMRHTVTLKEAQSFAYLRFKAALQIERWIPLSLTGDQLKPSPRGRIGVLFCRGTDARDLDQIYQAALRRDLYEVCS